MASILSKEGRSIQPQAFKLNDVRLINFNGDDIGIETMLSQIKIRESLFLPTMLLEITLKDAINFFETYSLSGQERITIDLERTSIYKPSVTSRIQLEFYVTEYSDYGRASGNASIQAYTIKGISSYAYNSKFLKISRAYTNNASDEIAKILKNDLFYDNFSLNGIDATTHTGILNIQEPLSAIEYLRKSAFDDKGAPFFFYQTMYNNGQVNLSSLTYLNDTKTNPVYNPYVFLKGYKAAPFSPDDYVERTARILETGSNLEMSKAFQGSDGAYASNNFVLDIKNKTFTRKIYDYLGENNKILRDNTLAEERIVFSPQYKIGRDNKNSLNTLPDAHQEFIATNSGAYGNAPAYNQDMAENIETLNSYMSLMNSMSQNIILCGDFNLNPGRKIELIYPRATEAKAYKSINPERFETDEKDKMLTGIYLITSTIHTFEFGREEGDDHYVNLEVRKDSIF